MSLRASFIGADIHHGIIARRIGNACIWHICVIHESGMTCDVKGNALQDIAVAVSVEYIRWNLPVISGVDAW